MIRNAHTVTRPVRNLCGTNEGGNQSKPPIQASRAIPANSNQLSRPMHANRMKGFFRSPVRSMMIE